ncbi:hypothetical protein GCM10012275_59590 [Longimycelium tulufanense]|uniref:DNA methylase N-4/N-6 domain-containing protein n=1 Tax=Longimycelium tulufanense TaxID=907463 RepID=A0A8J3CE25_9PSEU|nr:hypothetical protein [Longimycelium tulufanense]GGM81025.1 hypothetical protein GCM10012275_59590 [Longimycelium tulufanense]
MPKNLVRPTSVWGTGQRSPRQPLADRHVTATRSDTALTPAIARWIIATYTAPGDIVCDPSPGPGLVLAEALRAGRHALGLATQPQWDSVLEANLDLARLAGPVGTATLLDGVDDPRATELPGAVDLVLTGLRHTPASDPSRILVGCTRTSTPLPTGSGPAGTSWSPAGLRTAAASCSTCPARSTRSPTRRALCPPTTASRSPRPYATDTCAPGSARRAGGTREIVISTVALPRTPSISTCWSSALHIRRQVVPDDQSLLP